MFIFVNPLGQTLIMETQLTTITSFSLPELDNQFNALVTNTRVTPKPIVNVQSTLGGINYLNVFGEDPLQIQIQGIIVGAACNTAGRVTSALASSVDFYARNGVINKTTPIKYTLQGSKSKQAFLVAMSITQDNSFADLASFDMVLLSENLDNRVISPPSMIRQQPQRVQLTSTNTGLVDGSSVNQSSLAPTFNFSNSIQSLSSFGEVEQPEVGWVVSPGLALSEDAVRD